MFEPGVPHVADCQCSDCLLWFEVGGTTLNVCTKTDCRKSLDDHIWNMEDRKNDGRVCPPKVTGNTPPTPPVEDELGPWGAD